MKKIFFWFVVCMVALPITAILFAGCSKTVSGDKMGILTLNKKYIFEEDVSEESDEQSYFIFTSSDMGEYHYYYRSQSFNEGKKISSYTITFRYKITGETVNCFFDSVEYDAEHNQNSVSSSWATMYGADEDFLISANGAYYFNEDYLKEIPNFGV